MSAIGDYVHFHKTNYIRYGTAFRARGHQPFTKSYKAQRDKNLARINSIQDVPPTIIGELEKRIANESTQQEAKQIAEGILNFNNSLNNITKDLEAKLLSEVPAKFSSDSGIRIVKSKIQTDDMMVNIEEAKKARARFYKNIETINKNTQRGKPVQTSTLKTLLKNASDFFNYLGIINNQLDFIKYRNLENMNTIAALRNMVELVSLSEMRKSTLNGVYGEVLTNMVSDNLRSLVGDALITEVKNKIKTGANRTEFYLDPSMIKPWAQREYYEKTKINLYQIKSSQDKVDASITINGYPMDASAKAYSTKGNTITPHLQDVSLLSALASTADQFGNHWLNMHALGINNSKADDEFTKQIQYEALASGNLLKQGAKVADSFVSIDATRGRVLVQTTKDILKKGTNSFIIKPELRDITFANEWSDKSWQDRIVNLLMDIHQHQISVSFKISFDK